MTQDAINELNDNISSYPEVKSIEITQYFEILLHFVDNRKRKCFHSGIEFLEWMENNLNREAEN